MPNHSSCFTYDVNNEILKILLEVTEIFVVVDPGEKKRRCGVLTILGAGLLIALV